MSGAPDLLHVRARAALLDVAEALAEQLDAVVLVGAQAVYIHTGDCLGDCKDCRREYLMCFASLKHM